MPRGSCAPATHLATIGLEAAAAVVHRHAGGERDQPVGDAATAARGVRNASLRSRAPAAHRRRSPASRRGEQRRDVVRVVLAVAVERDDDLAARVREAGRQRGGLAEVAVEVDDAEVRIARARAPRAARACASRLPSFTKTISYGPPSARATARQLGVQRPDVALLVVDGNDDRERRRGVGRRSSVEEAARRCRPRARPRRRSGRGGRAARGSRAPPARRAAARARSPKRVAPGGLAVDRHRVVDAGLDLVRRRGARAARRARGVRMTYWWYTCVRRGSAGGVDDAAAQAARSSTRRSRRAGALRASSSAELHAQHRGLQLVEAAVAAVEGVLVLLHLAVRAEELHALGERRRRRC